MATINMTRRECLKSLAALWVGLALPWQDLLASEQLLKTEHPRIAHLRSQVFALTVDENYKGSLLRSIANYRNQILERPVYMPDDGLSDLDALHKVTGSDEMERWLGAAVGGGNLDMYIPFG